MSALAWSSGHCRREPAVLQHHDSLLARISSTLVLTTCTIMVLWIQQRPDLSLPFACCTGGVGRYLGAAGEFKYQSFVGTEIDALLELWVPKLSSNW